MSVFAQLPDGRKLEFPDGTDPAVIQRTVKKTLGVSAPVEREKDEWETPDPTGGGVDNFLAGAGRAVDQGILGLKQVGALALDKTLGGNRQADVAAQIEDRKRTDAALMDTGAGQAGNIAGNIAMTLGLPGAGTARGAAAAGGALGFIQPVAEGDSRLANTALGAGAGVAAKVGGDKLGQMIGNRLSGAKAAGAIQEGTESVKNEALKAAKAAGYVLPPSSANPSKINQTLEGISGKVKTAQVASERNQTITNDLARKAMGIAKDEPLTVAALDKVREGAGVAYETIKKSPGRFASDADFSAQLNALGNDFSAAAAEFPEIAGNAAITSLQKALDKPDMSPLAAVELIKKLRFDSSKNFKAFDDPAKAHLAVAQRGAADAIEGLIERNLAATNPTALKDFQAARKLIAKTYDIEDALEAGNVSAAVLARKLKNGKPLSDELETIAKVAASFPKATQALKEPAGAISPVDIFAGVASSVAAGHPAPMAMVWGRPAVRNILLSKPYQAGMTTPSYGPNALTKGANALMNNSLRPILLPSAASAGAVSYRGEQDAP